MALIFLDKNITEVFYCYYWKSLKGIPLTGALIPDLHLAEPDDSLSFCIMWRLDQ